MGGLLDALKQVIQTDDLPFNPAHLERANMNSYIKKLPYARKIVQILGLILVVIGLFRDIPLATTLVVGFTFLMGPVFCGWVCPFGLLQEIARLAGERLGIRRRRLPRHLHRVMIGIRYVMLALILLISSAFVLRIFSLDPRANWTLFLTGNGLAAAAWIVIALFTALSLFTDRPFCSYLCSEGASHGLFGAARPLTVSRDAQKCIGCRKCDRICPMGIDISGNAEVRSLQCVDCMSCVSACPVPDTLRLKPAGAAHPQRRIIFLLLMAAAIAGFSWTVAHDNALTLPFETEIRAGISSLLGSSSGSTSLTGSAAASTGDAAGVADGTYEGSGSGFRGETTVTVTVKDEIITSIEFQSTGDDQQWFEQAWYSVTGDILSTQDTDVDTVSGATYSSIGIKAAVADALTSAGGTNVDSITENVESGGRDRGHGGRGKR